MSFIDKKDTVLLPRQPSIAIASFEIGFGFIMCLLSFPLLFVSVENFLVWFTTIIGSFMLCLGISTMRKGCESYEVSKSVSGSATGLTFGFICTVLLRLGEM